MSVGNAPEVPPQGERALLAGRQLACLTCGRPLVGRQRGACSPRCRAAASRRRKDQQRQAEARELADLRGFKARVDAAYRESDDVS
jgi:hypothetical protein